MEPVKGDASLARMGENGIGDLLAASVDEVDHDGRRSVSLEYRSVPRRIVR